MVTLRSHTQIGVNKLKTTYQRNLALGMITAIAIILTPCVMLFNLSSENIVVYNPDTLDIILIDNQQVYRDNKPSRTRSKSNPIIPKNGFLGFGIEYRFVNDYMQPQLTKHDPAIVLADNPVITSDDISFSIFTEDSNMGIHIPYGYDYIFRNRVQKCNYREVTILRKVDPEYPLVAQERSIEGNVVILVYVDKDGEMKPFQQESPDGSISYSKYCIVSEEPDDWFFADNLIKTLPHWIFSPKIENGNVVSSFLKIKYSYCLGITCSKSDSGQVNTF